MNVHELTDDALSELSLLSLRELGAGGKDE
jgi:hypothetical protein